MFSALSENTGNLQNKLSSFLSFAPIANLHNSQNAFSRAIDGYWREIVIFGETIGMYEVKAPGTTAIMNKFCNTFGAVCKGIDFFIGDGGSPYCDPETNAVLSYRQPSSASLYQVGHYGQLTDTGVFKKYDYGTDARNIQIYGTATPPMLKFENIKNVPIALFVGLQDTWGDPTDIHTFKDKLSTR